VNNLEFVQARPGSDLWILLVGSALPLIFELFETIRIGRYINNASVYANDMTPYTNEQGRRSMRLQTIMKRLILRLR
jgi:hypothetical protein